MNSSILQRPRTSQDQVNGKDSSAKQKLETLDLSKKNLQCLSEDLYRENPCIKSLHLEGNALPSLPDDLFFHLPHLVWLDLRNNEITGLPSTVGRHRHLQYLLLEGNPIRALPIELGNLSTLKALNLRHCPLEFPPEDIVHKGLASILSFLRSCKKEDHESGISEFPPIEKLNLKELRSSMDLSSDWSSNEEMKRFEMLKHKLEEMVQNEPLNCHRKPQNVRDPGKGTGWKFLTESRHALLVERRKSASDRQAEEKERLANFIQKQRSSQRLAKTDQTHSRSESKKQKNRKSSRDLDTSHHKTSRDKQKSRPVEKQEMMEKARASRDLRLEHRIKQHIQSMQERKKNPKRSAQEEMEAARKELEVASLLQAEILQQKRERDAALEYRFTAFTGEACPSDVPGGGPQNVFAVTL
ncbi:leucine-rich repeat-containing protein 27 isoform X2 [Dendrobates tinctorius]|uniref:leucine-rich repeat-containing protein 27 isoform X2 n=1 Tax=Dendrobates tinctorius TaxID=92724 RepID=UPI003CC9F3EE